jgi:hypothetical protein
MFALIAAGLLIWSVARDVPHSWSLMQKEHDGYANYTALERAQSYGAALPLPMNLSVTSKSTAIASGRSCANWRSS